MELSTWSPTDHTIGELVLAFGFAWICIAPFVYIGWRLFVAFMTIPARMVGWFAGETATHAKRQYKKG